MNSNLNHINILLNSDNINNMLNYALKISDEIFLTELKDLNIVNYKYTPKLAIEELGLDLELVNQLIEDYVIQIIKSNIIFLEHINELQDAKNNNKELDYTPLRELAHKNLGVARNLRIEDSEKILYEIMTNDNLDYILRCMEGLMASVILLKPTQAYNTIRLIKIKDSI